MRSARLPATLHSRQPQLRVVGRDVRLTVTNICPNGGTYEEERDVIAWLLTSAEGQFRQPIGVDGQTLEGTQVWPRRRVDRRRSPTRSAGR
jgi:hypothetical protein